MPGDASLNLLVVGPNQSYRLIFSPLGEGSRVRLHFSNRFGLSPVSFDAVEIAHRVHEAEIDPQTSAPVLFSGNHSVTIPAGADVFSDSVAFDFGTLDDLAVTIATSNGNAIGVPTHHFTARQHSYVTLPGFGNQIADSAGTTFTQTTTTRPFLVGMDSWAPAGTSALLTLGDSLTDGYQSGPSTSVPESPTTLDLNDRYPDFLKRRLDAAGRPIFVSNAGISGNKVRSNSNISFAGPTALARVDPDVLVQAGVTDVILWEGINDITGTLGLTNPRLPAAYAELIGKLHASGLRVLQGTIAPKNDILLEESRRQDTNDWIRTQSPADAVLDFDAAVRDPDNPRKIQARYDGGDGTHLNAWGYWKIAQTVDLSLIGGNGCGGQ